MKVQVEIATRTFVRFWLVLIGFALTLLVIYLSQTALAILLSAGFLALALSGPVSRLRDIIPGRSRVAATALAFVSVVAIVTVIIFLVIPPVVQQSLKIADTIPHLVADLGKQWSGAGELIERYNVQPQLDAAIETARSNALGWAKSIGSNVINGLGSVFSTMAAVLLTLVIAFLLLIEGPAWMNKLWGLYVDKDKLKLHHKLSNRMHKVISGYVTGQLVVAGIGAIVSALVVVLLSVFFEDLPMNLAFPTLAITFLLALIPMFGSTIAGILVTLLLVINSVPAAIIFPIFFVIYQQIENNAISPAIQSKYVELSPLAVLVAVTIGLYLFGIAGGIISIPIAGCIKVLLEEYLAERQKKRQKNDTSIAKLLKHIQGSDS